MAKRKISKKARRKKFIIKLFFVLLIIVAILIGIFVFTRKDIEYSVISDKIYNDFMNEKTILSKDRKTGLDIWVSYIAFIFGLYFKESLEVVRNKDYINILVDRFNYKNSVAKIQMENIRNKANNYIKQNCDK